MMELDQLRPSAQKRVLRFKRDLALYFRRINKKDAVAKDTQEKPSMKKDSSHVTALPVHKR